MTAPPDAVAPGPARALPRRGLLCAAEAGQGLTLASVPALLVLISAVVLLMAVGTVHQLLMADGWGLASLALLGPALGLLMLTMGARKVPRFCAAARVDEDGERA